jgi:hypothetical protein
MISSGGDPDVSAKAAGHSKETKAKYYKKVSFEEAQESFGRHHPAFVEGVVRFKGRKILTVYNKRM